MTKIEGNSKIELAIRELQKDSHPPAALPLDQILRNQALIMRALASVGDRRNDYYHNLMAAARQIDGLEA